MCGRFTLTARPEEVAARFGVAPAARDADEIPLFAPRFNIAPGQPVLNVDASAKGRALALRHWGLVPSWATDPSVGHRMINARAETAAERPAFRDAFRHRRCLVPADGFFEWAAGPAPRQPYYIRLADRSLFAIAGLFERWRSEDGEILESCTLLTTDANAPVAALHARMPVILPESHWDEWLDPARREPSGLAALLRPWPDDGVALEPVSARVNDVRIDDAACIAPVPPPPVQERLF